MRTTRYLTVTTVAALLIYGSAGLSWFARNYAAGGPRFHVNAEPGSGTAIRYDARLCRTRGFRSLRRQSSGHLRRHDLQARRLHRDANSEQHHVATGVDTSGNAIGVRFQDADPLSIRRGADGLSW